MNNTVKTDVDGLMRDTTNHALINSNAEAWRMHKQQRNLHMSVDKRVDALQEQVNGIQNTLNQILELLKQK